MTTTKHYSEDEIDILLSKQRLKVNGGSLTERTLYKVIAQLRERVAGLEEALRMRDTFLSGDAAASGLQNIAYFIEPHFTGAKGRQMSEVEIIEAFSDLAKEAESSRERVRELEGERAAAMVVLEPSMPESGLEDACRQLKQAYISERDNAEEGPQRMKDAMLAKTKTMDWHVYKALQSITLDGEEKVEHGN